MKIRAEPQGHYGLWDNAGKVAIQMLIEVSNTLSVNNPTKELMTWCKKNLVIANPEYAKKLE